MRLCASQWLLIAMVILLGLGSMLSACGKKGPLYLPEPPAAKVASGQSSHQPSHQPSQPISQPLKKLSSSR